MTIEVNTVLIALGSSLGDRLAHIRLASEAIGKRCGPLLAEATPIETAPVGGSASRPFLNSALICQTTMTPSALLEELMAIEREQGRERLVHWGDRTIDLDVILWKNADGSALVMHEESITIPHPRALERAFVLVPAAEIAGEWVHPISGRTLAVEKRELVGS